MKYVPLSDRQWAVLAPDVRISEDGRGRRPSVDNRKFIEAVRWVAITGATWRDLPPQFGKWNSVFRRYRHYEKRGVWSRLFERMYIPHMPPGMPLDEDEG